jgi:hypothetical protein
MMHVKKTAIALAIVAAVGAFAQEKSKEEELHIHRYAVTETAPWDAFEYMNRLAAKPGEGETAKEFAGRILGNIANVEGRALVKVPPGWERPAYDGFKMFFDTTGGPESANCAACHVPANFSDGQTHRTPGGDAAVTPPLRNLSKAAPYFEDESATTLEDVIRAKIAIAQKAKVAGEQTDPEYQTMNITEDDIEPLVAFLKQLEEVEKDKFREQILNHSILDTAYLWE